MDLKSRHDNSCVHKRFRMFRHSKLAARRCIPICASVNELALSPSAACTTRLQHRSTMTSFKTVASSRGNEDNTITPAISVPVTPVPPSESLRDTAYEKNRSTTQLIVRKVHTAPIKMIVKKSQHCRFGCFRLKKV